MRPCVTATPPGRAGPPRPSITEALSITRSCMALPRSAAITRVGPLHLEDVMHVCIEVAGQAADRTQAVHVDSTGGGVVEPVADVQVHDAAEHEIGATHGHDPIQPALHGDGGIRYPRRLHVRAWRHRE